MNRFLRRLRRADRGAAVIEFALGVPVLLVAIIGAVQLGILFFANAGLNNALDEGARYATVFDTSTGTRPTNAQITSFINSHKFGLGSASLSPTYTTGTSNNAKYVEITVSYQVPLNFIMIPVAPVTLTKTRRAYVY